MTEQQKKIALEVKEAAKKLALTLMELQKVTDYKINGVVGGIINYEEKDCELVYHFMEVSYEKRDKTKDSEQEDYTILISESNFFKIKL